MYYKTALKAINGLKQLGEWERVSKLTIAQFIDYYGAVGGLLCLRGELIKENNKGE